MNRSVSEQAIISLLPSLTGPIPSALLSHAISLLAQSRSKAASLKPEEEVTRAYACAHLACERLKQQLNLPRIEPRPPVPARIYKRVFAYFNTAIPEKPHQSTASTPINSPAGSRLKSTPLRRADVRTPTKNPAIVRNTLATRTPDKLVENAPPHLLRTTPRKRAVSPTDQLISEAGDTLHDDLGDLNEGNSSESADEQELPLPKYRMARWSEKDIHTRTGLGTMFVDSIDWLSEQNKEDFLAWRKGIRKRIKQIEQFRTVADASG